MTHVHYKFSSKLSYDTVVLDGPHITLRDLKRQIMGREKLRAADCDLQITNAQTKEEYTDDEGLIPKGSSVIVRRIPIIGVKTGSNSKTRNTERSDIQLHHAFGADKAMDDQSSSRALPFFSKMANLADADVSEEDKIKVMMNQSTYDSMNYSRKFGAVLPANYTCYRCGSTGHHIRNCPTSGQDKNVEAPLRIKKSTGIPRSFMVEVDDPNIKGAMLTNCGHYAIPAIHAKAYAASKKEKPPFIHQEQPHSEEKEDPIPDELLCLICHDLLNDAVVIPCCGNSYCDDCIRNALLESEEHVCPTCNQSDVSPDTLIANKFIRQAVNTFMKERGQAKSLRGRCDASQFQKPTPTPSPVPTPPPLTVQSQPLKPLQSTRSQQDPLRHRSQAADTPPSSQVCGAPPTVTGPTPAPNTPSTSLQPPQSHLEIYDKGPEEKTHDDSAPAAPSVLVSHKDPTAAPSQPIPLVDHTPAAEQQQTVTVNLQQFSSGPSPRHSVPSACWESSSPSSGCPTGGWSESNTQQPPPSSSSSSLYPAAPPPLFPSPHFHTFLAAQQPLNSYPPGYPPATPVWTLPIPQGAPIPSLCSSTSASSIPTLIPKEWYLHQRNKKEGSPPRGSTYRHSSSRSNSKSSKSKSSHSYSRSSSRSRSRSRSRSKGRSRPHSPYTRHRNLPSRSHSSRSYSYGYKRSPTPSSSSSPRVGYHSRSKSPSDHRKSSHHSRHRSKKSASSSSTSRRRGERSQRDAGGSGGSSDSYPHTQQANQTSSLELDRERYLQWKREYKEWCEKYFTSYVGHFHHLPPPLLNLPPSSFLQWGDREGSRNQSHAKSESRDRLPGRRTARKDRRSPPSQSSSDSRSPPSQSSSDSRTTPSQSSSDSRSSPSHSSNDSRSPPSQSSSDGRSTPAKHGAQQRGAEKNSRPPIKLTKGSKEVERQERRDNKEKLSTLKHEQKSQEKHEEGRGEESSAPDVADSADDSRKDKRSHNTGPKAAASEALESVQPLVKPDKRLDKDYERKSREQRNLEREKGWGRDKYLHSRQDVERRHKEKPSRGPGSEDPDRGRNPGGSRASDSRSEKNRKREGEDLERSCVESPSGKCLKTNNADVPETPKSKSLYPFEGKKQNTENKKERKTWPLTERDIWEEGMKVKPQKKISINISLDGKRKEEKTERQDSSYLESITGKTKEETDKTGNGEEEKPNRGETDEKKESSRDQKGLCEENKKTDEREARPMWERATFRDDRGEMWGERKQFEKKEEREEEDFDLWHCALRGVEEAKKERKKQWKELDKMEASRGVENYERRSMRGGKEGERRVRDDSRGRETREFVSGTQREDEEALMQGVRRRMRKDKEEDMSGNKSYHDGPNTTWDDVSSYEDHQARKAAMKSLEEYTEGRATDRRDELILIKVPHSKWEEEEEWDEGAVFLPPSSFTSVTAETPTEGGHELKSQRSADVEGAGPRATERGRDREREKNSTLSSSQRSVAPSSGKNRRGSTLSTERDRERTREEEEGRDGEKERGHGSISSVQKRNPPSSSHSCSSSVSHDSEGRDRQRGGDQDSSRTCCPGEKSSSGRSWDSRTLLELKDHPHFYHKTQDPSGSYRHQERPAGTHHFPPSLSHCWGEERDLLPFESSGGSELSTARTSSPGWELMQNRKESKVEKEGKGRRENQDMVGGLTKWEGGRELEEGERPSSSSSVSSSASQESGSSDNRREEWKKKQKKHKKEKRQPAPELLEDGEPQRHKKKRSTKSRDGGEEEESGREVDDRWKEKDKDNVKLCSLMLF